MAKCGHTFSARGRVPSARTASFALDPMEQILRKSCGLNVESLYAYSAGPCHARIMGLSNDESPCEDSSSKKATVVAPASSAF